MGEGWDRRCQGNEAKEWCPPPKLSSTRGREKTPNPPPLWGREKSTSPKRWPLIQFVWSLPPVGKNVYSIWITDLDSEQFAVRETATAELAKHGAAVLPALWKALADRPALETRHCLEQWITKQDHEAQTYEHHIKTIKITKISIYAATDGADISVETALSWLAELRSKERPCWISLAGSLSVWLLW